MKTLYSMNRAAVSLFAVAALTLSASAQVVLSGTSYTQNFNSIGSGLPTGWAVYTGATASGLGTAASFNTATSVAWSSTTGQFANYASATGLTSTSLTSAQTASTDRAIGVRQTGSFGDSGASIAVRLNTSGYTLSSLSFDLMMLSVQTRSTTYTVDYGIGTTPATFTALTTWSDPGVFGATGFSFNSSQLAALSNQSNVWIRIAALSTSTGTGSRDTIGIDNFSLSYSAIPEPSTYAAIAGALALVGVAVHRRRRSA